MPYIGRTLGQGTRSRFLYTATAGQTTFSGSDSQSNTLAYADNNGLDCFQNGVLLKGGGADYTATTGTSVVLTTGASVNDVIEILVYDVFAIADHVKKSGDTITGQLNANGGAVFNEDSADVDFRVESNGNANMLFVDGGNDSVVIGHNAEIPIVNANVELSVIGTNSTLGVARFGGAPTIALAASASGTVGSFSALSDDDAMGYIFFGGDDGTDIRSAGASINAAVDGTPGSNDMPGRLVFSTTADGASSPTEAMRIDKSGNVGIGTTVGTKALTVARNIGGTEGDILDIESNGSGGGTQPMIRFGTVPANGNTLGRIGFIDIPSYGGGFVVECNTGSVGDSTTEHFRVSKNGDLTATDTSISSNSDSRLKKDISDYTYDLEKFKSYDVKQFNWKNPKLHGDKTNQIGFLAQDVQSIDPQWVGEIPIKTKSEDAQYLDKDLMSLTSKLGEKDAMYISVIQQLIAKNDALEVRIKKLEDEQLLTKVETLEAKVTALEAK